MMKSSKVDVSNSSNINGMMRKVGLSSYLFSFVGLILFLIVLYAQNSICIFSQLQYSYIDISISITSK